MRMLVTGATGFLGAHLVERFKTESVQLALLLRDPGVIPRLGPFPEKAQLIQGDLLHLSKARSAIEAFKPDTVVHLAWSGVGSKNRNDRSQISDNLLPALEFLEMTKAAGATHFIGIGSQAEYGPHSARISEDFPTRPTTLYGSSKLATSILLHQLAQQTGSKFTWVRVFSTYGPGEDAAWLIPYLTAALLRGERPSLTGCEQLWDYLYATDAADALAALALQGVPGVFNLGSGQARPLREVVETIRDLINPALPIGFGEMPYRPDQVMHLEADITRLQKATGWKPRVDLQEGLKQSVAWQRRGTDSGKA